MSGIQSRKGIIRYLLTVLIEVIVKELMNIDFPLFAIKNNNTGIVDRCIIKAFVFLPS